MSIVKTQGLVLKYTNLNEADRILTLLTKDKGKIQVFARGCRRPKSRLISSCEVFSVSDFVLYKGSSLFYINSGELRESFYELRGNLLKLSYAVYFTELADTVTYEDMNCKSTYLLLARTLYYLSKSEIPVGILSCAYQIKLMDISGFRPILNKCANCGKSNDLFGFSINQGGVICFKCSASINSKKIENTTLEFFINLLSLPISRLNSISIDNTTFIEADKIILEYVQNHMGKKFKSMAFINSIKNFKV